MTVDIVWLRDDFRLDDQPALAAAADGPTLFLYVHDPRPQNGRPPGGAARWRLAQSLASLQRGLAGRGARLDIVEGEADHVIMDLAAAAGAGRVLWARRYEAASVALDAGVKASLKARGVEALSRNGRLMREPWEVAKTDGKPSGTFSAFWRRHRALGPLPAPVSAPERLEAAPWPAEAPARTTIAALRLTPTAPDWSGELALGETPGEEGAQDALRRFVEDALPGYADARDLLASEPTSRLSAHLRFGELSAAPRGPRDRGRGRRKRAPRRPAEKYLAELGWREFSYALLYAHSDLATRPLKADFERFPFRADEAAFRAWARGRDRLSRGRRRHAPALADRLHAQSRADDRGVVPDQALMIDWRRGEGWFWDTLCDADPANNPASWQWVAGSGADAAPYFRIFNPVLQGEKFDPDGTYVRRWVPELAGLKAPHVHAPWRAPAEALADAGVALGGTYPKPIVDHAAARARALSAFAEARHTA